MSGLSVGATLRSVPLERCTPVQRSGLRAIVAAAEHGRSFAAVTGETGTGKSAVLDMAAGLLGRPPVQIIRVAAAGRSLTSQRLIAQIAGAAAQADASEAIERALDRLLMPAAPFTRTLLLVDDAHALAADALAYLQLAAGMHGPDLAPLQMVFAGRPEFWARLAGDPSRRLRERIGFRAVLEQPITARSEAEPVAGPAIVPVPHALRAERRELVVVRPARPRAVRYGLGSAIAAMLVIAIVGPLPRQTRHLHVPGHAPQPTRAAARHEAAAPGAMRLSGRGGSVLKVFGASTAAASPLPRAAARAAPSPPARHLALTMGPAPAAVGSPPQFGPPAEGPPKIVPVSGAPGTQSGPPIRPSPAPAHMRNEGGARAPAALAYATRLVGAPVTSTLDGRALLAATPPSPTDPALAFAIGGPTRPALAFAIADPIGAAWPAAVPSPPHVIAAAPMQLTQNVPPGIAAPAVSPAPAPAAAGAASPPQPLSATDTHAQRPAGTGNGGAPPAPPAPGTPASAAAAPPPEAAAPQPAASLPPALVAALLSHGDDMLQLGDISAARLLYQRAAEAGSAAAAIALGKTYDPGFLAQIGAKGIAPDPATAAQWYRRAGALGDPDAGPLLARLGPSAAQ